MKLKALVLTLVIAALGVSVAAATASPNHGKPPRPSGDKPAKPAKAPKKHADACRGPQIMLRGTFVSGSADSTGAGSFAMVIAKTNHPARRLGLLAGSQVSITVDARTKYRRHGHASLSDLLANDRLSVKARACKTAEAPSGDGSGTGSGSDEPSNPAPTKGKGHGKRHGAVAAPASFTLIARKVDAHPPKPPKDGGDGTTTGDTGTTGTTGTTTDQEDTGTTGTTTDDGSSS
jgi:hypothetical protein